MKVLFIAGRSEDAETLMIEREVTLLQQRASVATGEDVVFHFLPDIAVESLPLELSRHRPDVLHVSAHCSKKHGFEFANSDGDSVNLTPENLLSLLHPEYPPRLIYLNGCESSKAAGLMTRRVPMAIGSTAPISNSAAMTAAVLFYDRLISGFTVQNAFDAAQAIISAIHAKACGAELFNRPEVDPKRERFHQIPRLIAALKKAPPVGSDKDFEFELGIMGCRRDTVQVVFFTDDETFITDDDEYENDLCFVVRDRPVRGILWSDFKWGSTGDCVFHACATTSAGQSYSVSSTLCEALVAKTLRLDDTPADDLPWIITSALDRLRSEDGSRVPVASPSKRKRKSARESNVPNDKTVKSNANSEKSRKSITAQKSSTVPKQKLSKNR